MVQHVGTGVVHREVLSGGEGSVLGRYPVGGWAEVPRPLSSKASGPVVAWCVGGGGSHVACGFGDGTVEVWDWTTLLALCGASEWRCPAVIVYKQREAGREARFVALSRAAGFEVREICLTPPSARGDSDSAAAAFADPDPPDGPGLDAVRCLALEWTPPGPVDIPPD